MCVLFHEQMLSDLKVKAVLPLYVIIYINTSTRLNILDTSRIVCLFNVKHEQEYTYTTRTACCLSKFRQEFHHLLKLCVSTCVRVCAYVHGTYLLYRSTHKNLKILSIIDLSFLSQIRLDQDPKFVLNTSNQRPSSVCQGRFSGCHCRKK